MAATTYLQAVNSVLRRLRESEVSSVQDTAYSKLIGEFVNDAKRQCEDAYNWNALRNQLTVTTTAGTDTYTLTGSGQRFRVVDVYDNTNKYFLENQALVEMHNLVLNNTQQTNQIQYYAFNGVDSNGDTKVTVYPIPDNTYTLKFNVIIPSSALSANADTIVIPVEPVIFNAASRAIAERGEDGGIASAEMFAMFRQSLGDAIALEAGRYIEEDSWVSN
jgi:hypothetical protein